jgi:uncharacterized membrane protein
MAAAYMIAAGVLGGLIAAIFGLVDWLGIPRGTRARSIGAIHGLGNVVVVALFAASWVLRSRTDLWHRERGRVGVCSFAGAALALVTSWLGGECLTQ